MYELKVVTRFAAAHQLKMVANKCENLHGHNWRVELRVSGDKLQDNGVLLDFGVIKKELSEIVSRLDHSFLNENPAFGKENPSSERIAQYIAEEFEKKTSDTGVRVSSVSVWESDDSCATYYP